VASVVKFVLTLLAIFIVYWAAVTFYVAPESMTMVYDDLVNADATPDPDWAWPVCFIVLIGYSITRFAWGAYGYHRGVIAWFDDEYEHVYHYPSAWETTRTYAWELTLSLLPKAKVKPSDTDEFPF